MATAHTTAPRFAARAALRTATEAAHTRVDAAFGGYELGDPAAYRHFLAAQAAAFLPSEGALEQAGVAEAIPDWPERRRSALLLADLADLGVEPRPLPAPHFDSAPAVCGGAYVLEGSRLGGAMLIRGVPGGLPRRFLAAPALPGAWRTMLDRLDVMLPDADALARAIDGAHAVFALFERAVAEHPHG